MSSASGLCAVLPSFVHLIQTLSAWLSRVEKLGNKDFGCETTLTQESSEWQEWDMQNKTIYQLVSM
jgi:hypothetical protein